MAYYYDRMYKGDIEIRSLIVNEKTLWTKNIPVEQFDIDESLITIFVLDSNNNRTDIVLATSDYNSSSGCVQDFLSNSSNTGPYEVYFGSVWITTNGGSITQGIAGKSNVYVITLPSTLVSVQSGFAYNDSNLVKCDLTNTRLTTIVGGMFANSGALADIGTIPGTVTQTQGGAFGPNSALATVDFAEGESPLTIGSGTFNSCSGIQTMTLPGRTITIEDQAFYGSTIQTLNINRATDSITGYPWGASSIGIINWTGTA